MPEPVRVRDNVTGAEYSTYAVNENGETYEGLTVLEGEAAVDATGTLLPPKYPEAEAGTTAAPDLAPEVADVPPATDTPVVAPSTTKAPRPTEPTTGPKAATPKES